MKVSSSLIFLQEVCDERLLCTHHSSVRVITRIFDLSVNSRADTHGLKLLEQQLARIRYFYLTNLGRHSNTSWSSTLISHLLQVGLCCETTSLANMYTILIRVAEESVTNEVGAAVS